MNHLGFLALAYLILVSFDLPSPSKELHLALAYALCCYEGEIAQALDPVVLRSLRERLTTLAASLRPSASPSALATSPGAGPGDVLGSPLLYPLNGVGV